ncbi:hypothetical protein AgCh_022646 [Apium graveolens]
MRRRKEVPSQHFTSDALLVINFPYCSWKINHDESNNSRNVAAESVKSIEAIKWSTDVKHDRFCLPKVIRNKSTGQPEGYGFIEFVSRAVAQRTLHGNLTARKRL